MRTPSSSCSSRIRRRIARAWASRSGSLSSARSDRPTASSTPFSGCRAPVLLQQLEKAEPCGGSTWLSLSWVVYRPAVSISTASSVNHQSQLRVPPTPRDAACGPCVSASGKFQPAIDQGCGLAGAGRPDEHVPGKLIQIAARPAAQLGLLQRVQRFLQAVGQQRDLFGRRGDRRVRRRWPRSRPSGPCPFCGPAICGSDSRSASRP